MKRSESEMRAEYDFSTGVRGKYAKHFADGTNLVALEPDLAGSFPDSESVNKALRKILVEAKADGPDDS